MQSGEGVEAGLRERKKRETRGRLGDVAARLFAEHGYDEVAISDVARAAGVSDQTVYNYFPTKPDLVFDRADEVSESIRLAVAERGAQRSPADAMRGIVLGDIERYFENDPVLAKGEFPAQCRLSPVLRRRALEFYDDVATAVAEGLIDTGVDPMTRRAYAAALVAVVQQVTAAIGAAVLEEADPAETRARLESAAMTALDDLSVWWATKSAGWKRPDGAALDCPRPPRATHRR